MCIKPKLKESKRINILNEIGRP